MRPSLHDYPLHVLQHHLVLPIRRQYGLMIGVHDNFYDRALR